VAEYRVTERTLAVYLIDVCMRYLKWEVHYLLEVQVLQLDTLENIAIGQCYGNPWQRYRQRGFCLIR
jgi:hypothetical protein